MKSTTEKTHVLVEGALMIALATVLSYLKLMELPQGGSITLEMIPLLLMSYRNGNKWGLFTCFVHGFIQMVLGFQNVLYCATLVSQIGCILLDYLVAFTVLGLAGGISAKFGKGPAAVVPGTLAVCAMRFVCHFISGVWLWGAYAPEGQTAIVYSIVYNGSFMLVDTAICVVCLVLLRKTAPRLFERT